MVPDVKQGKQLPEGWEFKELSSLFQERRETSSDLEKYPLYSLTIEEGLIEKPERYNREFLLKNRQDNQYRLVYPGDFVFNPMNLRWGAIAMSRLSKAVTVSAYYNVLSLDSSIIPSNLLLTILRSPQMLNVYDNVGKGTLVEKKRVHLNVFLKLKIPIPPITQSKEINAILSSVDEAIASTQAVIDQTRKVKQGLLQQLLTRGIGHTKFKESAIGEIPEVWEVRKLSEIALVSYGLTVNQSRREGKNKVPYLTVANTNGSGFNLNEVKTIGILEGDAERYSLKYGDLLLIEGNGNKKYLGLPSMWRGELPFVLHQNHLIKVRVSDHNINPEWILFCLGVSKYRSQILREVKTSSGLHTINSRVVSDVLVPVPVFSEQERILQFIRSIIEEIETESHKLIQLQQLKRGLMQDLLTGKVRVGCTS